MKFKRLSGIILACALFVTGCSGTGGSSEKDDKANASTASYPMTIKHAFGETVIESEPKNIASIGWGNQDVALALGVVPVGVSKANYGTLDKNGLQPWTGEKYKELKVDKPNVFDDTAGLDYEAISESNPDVILASYSGITKEEYDLLSKIAPVVPYEKKPWQTLWRDQITLNATGMGRKEDGEKLVADLDKLIKDKTSEYPELKGKKAVFCYFTPNDLGKFYIYLPTDPRAAYLNDLGLELPENIAELAKKEEGFSIEVSAENIELLKDADLIIAYGNDDVTKSLQADKLLGTVDAIKKGHVAMLQDNSALAASGTPTALSIPATIDEYLKTLNTAVTK